MKVVGASSGPILAVEISLAENVDHAPVFGQNEDTFTTL